MKAALERMLTKLKNWLNGGSPPRRKLLLRLALALLIALLCISIIMQSNIQRRYSRAADYMREQLFQSLVEMTELFSRVDDPGVDVQHKLIPAMTAQYEAVAALNEALTEGFGARAAVLTPEQIAGFDAAFEEYSDAYRQGLETGLAKADMALCIEQVQAMIDERYTPKVEPTPPVLIIDGSSGQQAAPAN